MRFRRKNRAHRPHSLTRRLTLTLVLVQLVAMMIGYAVLLFVFNRDNLASTVGGSMANSLIMDAIQEHPANGFRLDPQDQRLKSFLERHPGTWYVVTDGTQTLSGGGAEARVRPEIDELRRAVATAARVIGPESPVIEHRKTEDGLYVVLTGGAAAQWTDGPHILYDVMRYVLLPLSVPLMAGAGFVLVFVARRLLRSLRVAADAASKISPNSRGQRLPTVGIPRELMPLVGAVNSALERLDEGHERQRRFVADAAHELRTPVAVLRTRLDALPDGPVKTELMRDSRRISDLATRLLEMERVQHTAMRDEPVDVVSLARSVAVELGPLALDAGYDLEVKADVPDLTVRCDFAALRGALLNLIGNAIAHAGGHGLICVRVSRTGAIEVSDDGPGIPKPEADKVFEPFHRLGTAAGGAGLGLSIVRETMKAHGGFVTLLNPGGPGAVFRLTFPPERLAA